MSEWKETELGKLPITWNVKKIGEIGDVTKLAGFEYTSHFKYVDDGEIIALRALNVREGNLDLSDVKRIYRAVSDNLERSKLYKGDILFTYVGANIGQFALVPENGKFHLAPNICRIRCNNGFEPYFLYSYFRTNTFKESLEGFSHGSSQPTMPMGSIRQIPIPIPTPSEQKSISSLLHSLDNKIDLLLRQNATLEKMAETLFRQWFIQEPKEDWGNMPLSKMADFLNGLACQKFPPKNEIDKLPVLKIKELSSGITENSDWASTDIKPEYIVRNGDVIFAWSASLMVKIWDGQDCILNQHLFRVTSEDYPKWFYYLWCKHHLAEFISIAASHATTMGHIKRGDLDEAKVLIPSPKELAEMTEQAEPLIQKIIANNIQINTLTKLRDSLLPKLMCGEVKVEI
ncbi:MAG: restriction endonuclease subunit S [Vicingaceae bacterium]|nr:MAG: restriction endonuclease subunit S [Vicingaceae bacterium]